MVDQPLPVYWPMLVLVFSYYIGIDRLKLCTKCMLVCASPIAGPLASAAGQLFFISACPPTP